MKGKLTITLIALSLLTSLIIVDARQAKQSEEPEYLSVFFYLNPADGALVSLERQTANVRTKIKAMGFGGGEAVIEVKGGKSPVRFKTDQKLEFVVRVASTQIDPLNVVQFIAWKSKKDKRSLVITKVGPMGAGGSTNMTAGAVAFNASKYGQSSFKISPAQPLPPGEYALGTGDTGTAFCFGVDAVEN